MNELQSLLDRAEQVLSRLEQLLPPAAEPPPWEEHRAFRWRKTLGRGRLVPVRHPHRLRLRDLRCVERQKTVLARNLRQFVAGLPANNVLLWGARGTGKSSLVKALLNDYGEAGLRLIEVDKHDLTDLPDIVDLLYERPEKFLLYCDDLSFEGDDPSYKALKAVLDGSISATPDNLLLCVTSNRRHLLPEYMSENLEARVHDGELHHGEAVEEKISLSERFGIWLSFYPFKQDEYLEIVGYWLGELGRPEPLDQATRAEALRWALSHGSRSGRVARQFARDWVGRGGLGAA